MRCLLFLVLSVFSLYASAQNLTGIWRGHFKSDYANRLLESQGIEDKYKFEVQLDQTDKAFKGVTYSYKTTVFYGKASCYGAVNRQTKKVLLEEIKILEVKTSGGGACIMTCFLTYSREGNEQFLEGKYTSMSTADSSRCGGGTVFLRKVETSDFYKEPFLVEKEKSKAPQPKAKTAAPPVAKAPATAKKPAVVPKTNVPTPPKTSKPSPPPVVAAPKKTDDLKTMPDDTLKKMLGKTAPSVVVPQVLASRTNELVKTITTSAKNVFIKIYDNGTIDNDTVSVFVDKKLVVSKQRLTENAIEVKIDLASDRNEHELVMVAENLGEIPPNTSLMVVTAGDQRYEVRITSTEQKNAVVLFRYRPE